MLTAASGREVPMATIVKPMIMDGTFIFLATEELPSTKKSAPFTSSTKPKIKVNAENKILSFISLFSFLLYRINLLLFVRKMKVLLKEDVAFIKVTIKSSKKDSNLHIYEIS